MILGDNPADHSFVLRDLVLIELSWHTPPLVGEGGNFVGDEGSCNFEVKIKTA